MTQERWRKVEELFTSALERTVEERATFLERACAGEPSLRQEVEALLSADERAGGFLEAHTPSSPATEVSELPSLPAGARLGPYELLDVLGSGGMGRVYRARDTRIDRDVAVKVVSSAPGGQGDFEQEARAAGVINHPNVLTIHDVGVERDVGYVVTERLVGETLQARLARGALLPAQALDFARQVAAGLAAAHDKGVVHRDLKPANLFVTADGPAKILDFGVARRAAPAGGEAPTAGLVVGTLGYMAPEQIRGERADPRSDVFSFGAVLYEMFLGERAFAKASVPATLAAVLWDDPPRLTAAEAAVPPALAAILRRCLRKDPQDRFASGRELLRALDEAATDMSPAPRPPMPAGLAAAAVLAIVAAAGAAWLFATRPDRIDSIAVLPFENVTGDVETSYLVSGLTETLTSDLAELRDLQVRTHSSVRGLASGRVEPRDAGRRLRVQAVVTGKVTRGPGEVSISVELIDVARDRQLWGGQYSRRRMDEMLDIEADIAREIRARLRHRLAPETMRRRTGAGTTDPDAYDLYLRGRHQWNRFREDGFLKAIDYFGRAIEKDPQYARAYSGLADAYSMLAIDSHHPAREVMPRAREAALRALEIDDTVPEAHNSLGITHVFYEWDWPGAERTFARALELRPHYADAHHYRSHYLQAMGRAEDGIEAMLQAVELEPSSPILSAELAFAYYFARQYEPAAAHFKRTLDANPDFVFASWGLAQVYEQQGRHAEAMAQVEQARAVAPEWTYLRLEEGCAHAAAGRQAEARQVVADLEKRGGYLDAGYVAYVFAQLGDREAAFRRLDRALQERSSAIVWLKVEPKFDSLRGDPRFAALLRGAGLPP